AAAQCVFFAGRHLVDDQYLEVRPRELLLALAVGLDLRRQIALGIDHRAFMAIGLRGQHAVDAPRRLVRTREFAALDPARQLAEHAPAGEGPEALDRRKRRDRGAHARYAGFELWVVARQRGEPAE